jgi:hypothetical protein
MSTFGAVVLRTLMMAWSRTYAAGMLPLCLSSNAKIFSPVHPKEDQGDFPAIFL